MAVQLRERGLTDRETEIALRILERRGRSRGAVMPSRHSLAAELSISDNTLRVHLMRIREKLGIVGRRGDDALADLVEGWTDDLATVDTVR